MESQCDNAKDRDDGVYVTIRIREILVRRVFCFLLFTIGVIAPRDSAFSGLLFGIFKSNSRELAAIAIWYGAFLGLLAISAMRRSAVIGWTMLLVLGVGWLSVGLLLRILSNA